MATGIPLVIRGGTGIELREFFSPVTLIAQDRGSPKYETQEQLRALKNTWISNCHHNPNQLESGCKFRRNYIKKKCLVICLSNSYAQPCLENVVSGRPHIQKDLKRPQAAKWVPMTNAVVLRG